MKQNNFIIFLFGMIFAQKIVFVGEIYIGEIISLVYLIFNFFTLRYSDFERKLIFFTLFTIILLAFVNIYHETNLGKSLKGSFAYIVFTAVIIALSRYFKKDKNFNRAIIFTIGIILGQLVTFIYHHPSYFLFNPWKFGLARIAIYLFLIIPLLYKNDFPKKYFIIFSIIIIYISFLNNSRALPFMLVSALIMYLLFYKSEKYNLKFFNKKNTFMWLPLSYFFVAIILGIVVAKLTPAKNILANFEEVSKKTAQQAQGEFGVTVSARGQLIGAFYAIKDRPLVGHGSYPEDKNLKYRMKQMEFFYKFNYIDSVPNPRQIERFVGRMLGSHSVLFDSIIAAGFLASLFWIFITYFFTKNYANYSNQLPMFFHFMIFSFFYSLFFNPWGGVVRLTLALTIVLLILYVELLKEHKLEQQDKRIN